MTPVSIKYVLVSQFCALTGYTPDAVQKLIARGHWAEGRQYRRAGGRVWIDLRGFESWVEKQLGT